MSSSAAVWAAIPFLLGIRPSEWMEKDYPPVHEYMSKAPRSVIGPILSGKKVWIEFLRKWLHDDLQIMNIHEVLQNRLFFNVAVTNGVESLPY